MLRLTTALFLLSAGAALAQSAISFGGFQQAQGEPIEVVSDRLEVDQSGGSAVFAGNVVATQGEMTLTGQRIEVSYTQGENRGIREMRATGGVTIVTPEEAAEAEEATYRVAEGSIVMTGDVLVTQGASAIAGQRMTVDLESGSGLVEGRVRTVFQTDQ